MFKWLFPLVLGALVTTSMAQAQMYDPQGRVIPHDERRIEAPTEASADTAPVVKPQTSAKKRHVTKHRTTPKPATKKRPIHKKHRKTAPR